MNDWVNDSKNSPHLSIAVLKEFWEKRWKKSLSHWRDCVLCSTERNCRDGGGGGAELSWWLEFSLGSQQLLPPSSASLPSFPPDVPQAWKLQLIPNNTHFPPNLIVLVCLVVQVRDLSHLPPHDSYSMETEKSTSNLIITTALPFAGALPRARHCSTWLL